MHHLIPIATLLGSLLACAGYGWCWLRLLRARPESRALACCCALALGMGTLAYLVLAVGLLGFLRVEVLGGLVAVGWIPALLAARGWKKDPEEPGTAPAAEPAERWTALAAVGFTALLALTTLAGALAPISGMDWDSLSYHLAAPKVYLREGRILFIAYDSHTQFPFTMQMLYTLGLAFGGAPAAKLFHWAAGWLTALAVGLWAARLEIGGRRAPMWAGPVAAAAFASMPLVLWEMGTGYIDLGTALFQFLALVSLIDAVSWREGKLAVSVPRAALAGVLTGFALGTKMTALLQFGLLGLGLLWLVCRAGRDGRMVAVKATAAYGLLALLVGSPWYLKSWLWVNNPVYPFFYSLFPNSYSWSQHAADIYTREQREQFGVGYGPGNLAMLLWDLAFHGRAFLIAAPKNLLGDKLGSLGPLWIGLLPLALWTRRLDWRAGAILLYAGGSAGMWFFLSQQTRYLMPVFAPLAVVVVIVLAALPFRPLRIGAAIFTAAALVMNLGMHVPVAAYSASVVTGEVSEEEYIRATVGGLHEAAGFVNRLPEDSRVAFYQETRGFYFDRRYFWANPGQHQLIPYDDLRTGAELAGELRRFGITHVLINYEFARGVDEQHWFRLLQDGIRSDVLHPVFWSEPTRPNEKPVVIYEIRESR